MCIFLAGFLLLIQSPLFGLRTIRQSIGGIGGREGVILSLQVAILGERAIAEVRPQAVQGPALLGRDLAIRLESGVGIPELGV